MELLRKYIKTLLLEKSLSGRNLERAAKKIAKEITSALLDNGLKQAFVQRKSIKFRIDFEKPKKLIWLRDIIVSVEDSNTFNTHAAYEFDLDATDEQRKNSDLIIYLKMPSDYTEEELKRFEIKYEGSIRHELEHSGQPTEHLMSVRETIKSEEDIWISLENAEKYYINQSETPAHVADWVLQSKREGIPAADLIDRELNNIYATGLHFGYTQEEMVSFMNRIREVYQFYLMTRWPDQDWPLEYRDEE
tara:strand:- start:49080 stop:49823 length:744 start_codon:yes stop_codon:yes gene_type:complete